MNVYTDTAGDVLILRDDWYPIRNYQHYLGRDLPITACMAIVTYKDSWGNTQTKIGVAEGLDREIDIRNIIDAGVNFYGYTMPEGDNND